MGKESQLSIFLDKQRIKYKIKDCIMALSTGHHNQIITSSGSEIPVNEHDHYRIGGQGITITTTIILILSDQHKLKLDKPIHQYLPRVPNSKKITIRQLCNDTAGLPDYNDDPAFTAAVTQNEFRVWTNDELLELVYQLKPLYEPGTNWNFGHLTNILILGNIIEMVTCESYAEVLKKYFTRPLELKNTQFTMTSKLQTPVLRSFTDERLRPGQYEESTFWNPSWGAFGTGTNSRASDMITISRSLGTGSLLTRKGFEQLVAPTTVGLGGNTPNAYYGMGVAVGGFNLDYLKSKKYPHTILWSDASFGGYTGIYSYIPSSDLVIHIQTNTFNQLIPEGNATQILRNLFNTFTIKEIVCMIS